jgi:hypothetical protein
MKDWKKMELYSMPQGQLLASKSKHFIHTMETRND